MRATDRSTQSRRPVRSAWPRVLALSAALVAGAWGGSAAAVDWSGVEAREVVVFAPGQGSWEWALTEKDHSGAPKFKQGKNCRSCHDGEQHDIGKRIAGGEKLEPEPGGPPSTTLKIRTAHDGERLHVQIAWKAAPASGRKADPEVPARITMMLADATLKEAARAGCWASCHDDAIGMASAPAGGGITKYLGASRAKLSRSGGGENLKPADALAALQQQGSFLEYWQAELDPAKPAQPVSGWILDKRHEHAPAVTTAAATFANGEWTVELGRPLAGGPNQHALAPGRTYAVGFALHDDYSAHRHHQVSFEYTLALDGGEADFVAAKH
jgi:cytochrome c-type protein NapC